MIANLDFLIFEPASVYHASAGDYLSSHQLADYDRCPLLYQRRRLGLIDDVDRPAFLFGRAVHTRILEGSQRFEQEFAVGGPINPTTGKPFGTNTKAWAEWAEANGKDVLTEKQYEQLMNMTQAVNSHPVAAQLLAQGIAEGVVRTEYCGLPCQIRIDWLGESGIVDLKTCDDLTWFESDAKKFRYIYQMAFYRAVLEQASGSQVPVHLIGVEKKEPYRCGTWLVHEDLLRQAQAENEATIDRLKQCIAANAWPTGYEDLRVFDLL
jgi:hypothetical protein